MSGETVRTLVVVSIVTVLVWLFAESRTQRIETIAVPVELSAGGGGTVFRLVDADSWTGVVEMELAGPTALIDRLRSETLEGVTLEIGDELPNEPGTRSVDVAEALRRDELFANSGVTVLRVLPGTVGLQTDRLDTLTLPVEVDLEGLETSGPVTVEPAEIVVRIPASIASGLELHARASVPPDKIAMLAPGRRAPISQVPIELDGLPEGVWGMRLMQPRVVVTLALPVRTETLTLREIGVRLSVQPSDLALWSIEIPPDERVLEDVQISASVSVIQQIERGELTPGALALIDLGGVPEDESVIERRVPVRLTGLPSGVSSDLGDRTVRVTARRRTASGGPVSPE